MWLSKRTVSMTTNRWTVWLRWACPSVLAHRPQQLSVIKLDPKVFLDPVPAQTQYFHHHCFGDLAPNFGILYLSPNGQWGPHSKNGYTTPNFSHFHFWCVCVWGDVWIQPNDLLDTVMAVPPPTGHQKTQNTLETHLSGRSWRRWHCVGSSGWCCHHYPWLVWWPRKQLRHPDRLGRESPPEPLITKELSSKCIISKSHSKLQISTSPLSYFSLQNTVHSKRYWAHWKTYLPHLHDKPSHVNQAL